MLDLIIKTLSDNGIVDYKINNEKKKQLELYFVKKDLDMRRIQEIDEYYVIVYKDFEKDGKKFRGSAETIITAEMDEAQVDKEIKDAYYAASFVANPYFELVEGNEVTVKEDNKLTNMSLEEIASAFVESFYSADVLEDAFINSSEFFICRKTVMVCNSRGVKASYDKTIVKGEFIVQCKAPQDVELFKEFEFDDLDTAELAKLVAQNLETVKARAIASPAPKSGKYDVIVGGEDIHKFMSIYAVHADASMIYPKYSQYEVGMNVQGEDIIGEKINLTLKPSAPVSDDGIIMKELSLIEDGVLKAITAGARFAYYMNVPATGSLEGGYLNNGSTPEAVMKSEPYLYVVSFSDLQVDVMSGHFGGEIRLAYLFDGDRVTPITGGSVGGSFLEAQKDIVFSKERYKDSKYEGPALMKLKNIDFAGANGDV